MNRRWNMLILAGAFTMVAAGQIDRSTIASRFLSLLEADKFAEAAGSFDATMKAALPASKLGAVWQSLTAQFGPFRGRGAAAHRKQGAFDVYSYPCRFENAELECHVTLNADGLIAGFFVRPKAAARTEAPAAAAAGESLVTVGKDPYALPGTLTMPDKGGPFPAVVLVHGSGPHDRDETIGPNKPFRDLAEGLRAHGVAVLRYEKRTYRHKASMPEKITLREEAVEDAASAVEALARIPALDRKRIFILGHSLGGMVAPRIAAQSKQVAGLILLAAPTRPFLEVLRSQIDYIGSLPGGPDQIAFPKSQLPRLEKLEGSDEDKILGAPVVYWRDLLACDPAKEAAGYRGPMLILQGERDYQVTMADFEGWKRALGQRQDVELRSFPRLNHLFIEGEEKSTPVDTMKPGHVSPAAINAIARWIGSH